MNACIYARTSRTERGPNTTSIPNQIDYCMALAQRHGLTVHDGHIFTDTEAPGSLPPSCWAEAGENGRPALAALVEAIQRKDVSRVIVRRLEKLGTSSEVLSELLGLFTHFDVRIIAEPKSLASEDDPRATFAASFLRPCIQYHTEEEDERRAKLKTKKLEEMDRLRAKIGRLESEIAEL